MRSRTRNFTSVSTNFSLNPIISSQSPSFEFDVVIIGAGIIGLTIARQFLKESDLSVAIIDASVPCASGATGAGQGYIWMAGKTPGTDTWELGIRGKKLWEDLAKSIEDQGMNPLHELGWKKTGSLLISRTSDELFMLKDNVRLYCEAGVKAEFLSRKELVLKEPLVDVEEEGGAAFLPDDCQIDAQRAVAFIQRENRGYGSRYAEFFNDPVVDVLRASGSGGIEGVRTTKNSLYCKKAVVVAAGSWSGSLIETIVEKFNIVVDVPVKPRKGHLLVIENFSSVMLNHGLMEVGYMDHKVAKPSDSGVVDYAHTMSISMTATLDAVGNLVLGSSRQFAGFDTEVDESIIDQIWKRAGEFLPVLRKVSLEDLSKDRKVRVGLRPYMPDGKPIISPVPGVPNMLLAAGHEGVGLTLAFGTAEMVFDMVFGNPAKTNYAPFSLDGRNYK
ncbi:Fad-dependent oxidoreductase family protein [Thalictrum thalictroides]|uniref:FAD-dependent oxidoreductase domain-containing protein 1 n=1 Tax=Thalictrum thalictroides TaxID=46969 RepID=A0A7J6WRX7_THATH|nr:Fad-dependent oxidoreductase family protein [Thalictrum thalictroides]